MVSNMGADIKTNTVVLIKLWKHVHKHAQKYILTVTHTHKKSSAIHKTK